MLISKSAFIGNTVYEDIDPILCSVSYASFNQTISMIEENDKGGCFARRICVTNSDLLIHPSDFSHLECALKNRCMPLICSIAFHLLKKIRYFCNSL